jgi:tetratricopeptide (TPR) repeat protein
MDPYNPQYLIHLAEVLTDRSNASDGERAKRLLKKAHILLHDQEKETDAEVMSTLGELFQREGDAQEAERWMERAFALCPENNWALLKSAWKHLLAEEYLGAHSKAERIGTAKDRIQKEKFFILGRCSLRMEKPISEARGFLTKAIGLGMERWEVYYWLGICFAHENEFGKALAYLLKSLKKGCTEKGRVFVQMGNVAFIQGDMDKAVRFFDIALKQILKEHSSQTGNRFHHEALLGLAKANAAKGNHEQAIRLFEELLALDSTNMAANYSMALLYERSGHLARSEDYLRRILTIHQESPAASTLRAKACAKLGILLARKAAEGHSQLDIAQIQSLCEEAKKMLDEGHRLGVGDDIHAFYKGLLEILTGSLKQGKKTWTSLQGKAGMGPELEINIEKVNYLFGIQCFEKGDFEAAIRLFDSAMGPDLADWRAEALFRWGMESVQNRSWERAGELLDKAIGIRPDSDIYHLAKGACLMLSGKGTPEATAESFSHALQINPQNPLGLFLLGIHLFIQGPDRCSEAIDLLRRLTEMKDADKKLKDVARVLILSAEINSGEQKSPEVILDALKNKNVLAKMPSLGKVFNILLARAIIEHHDGKSVHLIDELQQNTPEGALDYTLALVHSLRNRHEEALRYFKSVCSENGSDPNIARQYAGMLCYSAALGIKNGSLNKSLEALEDAKRVVASAGLT